MFPATNTKGPTGKECLLSLIEKNAPELTSAIFDAYHLDADDVNRLIAGLKINTHLIELRLLDCDLPNETVISLCHAIKENKTLKDVSLEEFMDYSDEIKEAIREMKLHLVENSARESASPRL